MTIFNFALIRSVRSLPNLILLLGLPAAVVVLPVGGWHGLPLGYHFYEILLLFSASKLVHMVMEDRKNKMMTRIGVAPVTHFKYLAQNLLAFALLLVGQSVVVTFSAWLLHADVFGSLIQLFCMFSVFSVTAISFSLAWCSMFRQPESSTAVMLGIILIMAVLGGTFFPIQAMPASLQKIAMLSPTYWFHEGIMLAKNGGLFAEQLTPLGILLLFAIAFMLVGSRRKLA
ncbi:ABC transporter permease [Paenibacillus sp. JNUCC32]|uniref:ABC transporter permease n=1 Tax=Paenibacillus sp. JNUCC32 TaxID=2777984 RepID=UPI001787DB10|nr:ABC transporter permease [Paenibacillus sp. JNUCC-32]QOT11156.1 ABC transporter permease [Paenibacillus sp. JNUCC-32]